MKRAFLYLWLVLIASASSYMAFQQFREKSKDSIQFESSVSIELEKTSRFVFDKDRFNGK